jgi:quercetin dioxygenase-like cupin family protein
MSEVMERSTLLPAKHVGKEKIYRLENEILKNKQVECPIRNIFADGIYAREMTIPAGTVATGAVHKTEHLITLVRGRITIWTERGMRELKAPHTFLSKPGTKRVAYAHEDCVLMTIHKTHTTDMRELISELTESKYEDLLENRITKITGESKCLLDYRQEQ